MRRLITIAGFGVVGQAIHAYYEKLGAKIQIYDPPKQYSDKRQLRNTDLIFLAVPTPHTERGFDLRYVDQVMPLIGNDVVVVIKSTVLPGTTDEYQRRHPHLKILFSPEFLTTKTAVRDFEFPSRQIVGYTERTRHIAEDIMNLLPHAEHKAALPAREAEMVKYMNNVFYALKVTFANQMYDLCEALGLDYDAVARNATSNEPMMGQNHWDVFHGGYRGYGGVCLPKDVRSLIQLGRDLDVDMHLLELIEELNRRHLQTPS